MSKSGETNIIPKGKLHKENNNLGNKDKGIPVVDKDGKKTYELEKEELILTLSNTTKVEELVARYDASEDKDVLLELGKFLTDEIINNTEDKSGRYEHLNMEK